MACLPGAKACGALGDSPEAGAEGERKLEEDQRTLGVWGVFLGRNVKECVRGLGCSWDALSLFSFGPPIGIHFFICDSEVEVVPFPSSLAEMPSSAFCPGCPHHSTYHTRPHGGCSTLPRRHFT